MFSYINSTDLSSKASLIYIYLSIITSPGTCFKALKKISQIKKFNKKLQYFNKISTNKKLIYYVSCASRGTKFFMTRQNTVFDRSCFFSKVFITPVRTNR